MEQLMAEANVSSSSISYTDTGGGTPPLIFVHAFGCARSDWNAQAAFFAPRHRVITADLGGHGESAPRPAHVLVDTHGDDIIALMDTLALPPAVIVGNSLGCRVALNVADQAPRHVRALVLVDGSKLSQDGGGVHAALGDGARPADFQAIVRTMFAQMFSQNYDPASKAALTERASLVPPELGMALLADIGRYDLQDMERALKGLRLPVLVIQSTFIMPDGKRRPLASGQSSPYLDLLRRLIGDLSIQVIPDCGHYPQLEYPNQMNALLEAFLRRIEGCA
jgi:pimeloyl-ACP methyl ester carboxylesterase